MAVTIASKKYEQDLGSYITSLYGYTFSLGNLSTFLLYDNEYIISKPYILMDYLPFFKQYSIRIELEQKYHQKPNLFAYDYYGSSELEWLVLFISGIGSPIDFNTNHIDVLPVNILTDINKLIVISKDEVNNSKYNPVKIERPLIDLSKQEYMYNNEFNLMDYITKFNLMDYITKNSLKNKNKNT